MMIHLGKIRFDVVYLGGIHLDMNHLDQLGMIHLDKVQSKIHHDTGMVAHGPQNHLENVVRLT
ncbi:14458_t:CDS:1, partial [Gigaspora rosea]